MEVVFLLCVEVFDDVLMFEFVVGVMMLPSMACLDLYISSCQRIDGASRVRSRTGISWHKTDLAWLHPWFGSLRERQVYFWSSPLAD
jgi:hypothetical protein